MTRPPSTEIGVDDLRLLIAAAVVLYDRYGDGHDVMSTSQVEVLERLRPLTEESSGDELAALSSWDALSIATTAVELTDHYGLDDEDLYAAVERARAYVEDDAGES
ncbi:hypothetical protein ABZ508_13685 [Streptomyces lavendulocolor]|uniref:Uncharacterized protein n=1 Tax=Streptomyces lavendulocolor TaxID=67316 RepID=A0ABV2W4D5_9ACTN